MNTMPNPPEEEENTESIFTLRFNLIKINISLLIVCILLSFFTEKYQFVELVYNSLLTIFVYNNIVAVYVVFLKFKRS